MWSLQGKVCPQVRTSQHGRSCDKCVHRGRKQVRSVAPGEIKGGFLEEVSRVFEVIGVLPITSGRGGPVGGEGSWGRSISRREVCRGHLNLLRLPLEELVHWHESPGVVDALGAEGRRENMGCGVSGTRTQIMMAKCKEEKSMGDLKGAVGHFQS